ncbi:diaminopimelate epimerase [Isoptericola sp. b441]|uniref:Diaminopimelate epimerase n=1 Tax=Actinotalea lenta TaxID=3064654 RepID=A0ABT9DE99_9CELL|nr:MULTISPECIES: diaminopimelate epimerase [unclassified Isoptericola]MDO8107397.1 diaminopimelate epimerase [Isoptericola sp. b441]MDO8120940.1 diaminopimelate epimerase [Isoptericola sp. b490]
MTAPLAVTKGHGTQNDFVLLDDRDGVMDLDADLVRALTDRRAGIGADGVLRLVGSGRLEAGAAALAEDPAATWFMDYRNADGSVAEMCGNGVRVLAAFAERLGVWDGTGELILGTRAGVRRVRRVTGPPAAATWYAVDMGVWSLPRADRAVADGADAEVTVPGLAVPRPGLSVDVGNPHTVLALPGVDELDAADLTTAPRVLPVPPAGTNVELVVPLGERRTDDGVVGAVRMRVHERGVGETRSCGTGACAAALAVRTWAGAGAPDVWQVEVPGGVVRVTVSGDRVELAGPAVLVADAVVDLEALR